MSDSGLSPERPCMPPPDVKEAARQLRIPSPAHPPAARQAGGPAPCEDAGRGPSTIGGWGIRSPEGFHPTRYPNGPGGILGTLGGVFAQVSGLRGLCREGLDRRGWSKTATDTATAQPRPGGLRGLVKGIGSPAAGAGTSVRSWLGNQVEVVIVCWHWRQSRLIRGSTLRRPALAQRPSRYV